jgi:cell wall-active antibiotic response 4TMS protein YvqF
VRRERSNRKRVVWGVVLITLGLYFLLGHLGALDWIQWRPLWPAIFMVIGFAWMLAPSNHRQVASGFTFVLIGFWFYACILHWYGLTFRTGWPVLLIVFGLEMILLAALERLGPAKPKEEDHHA